MPHECLTIRQAMDAAITKDASGEVETAWSDAGVMPGDPVWAGGTVFTDRREMETTAPQQAVWASVCSLGGKHGYYAADWLWRIRGVMDRLVGGPGLRRGRRSAGTLRLGDALDFWRVTVIDAPRQLELTAEMKLPGVATLKFDLSERAGGGAGNRTGHDRPLPATRLDGHRVLVRRASAAWHRVQGDAAGPDPFGRGRGDAGAGEGGGATAKLSAARRFSDAPESSERPISAMATVPFLPMITRFGMPVTP